MSLVNGSASESLLYKRLLTSGFDGLKKREYTDTAYLVVNLFKLSILLLLKDLGRVPKDFKKEILAQRIRFNEIQAGLNANMTIQQIANLPNVKKWLVPHRAPTANPLQQITQEIRLSYSTLAFPFQETRMHKTQYAVPITYWAKEFRQAEELLYHLFDEEDAEAKLLDQEMYRLQRILCFHVALFERKKQVGWLQVLADWAQTNGSRLEAVKKLLSKFDKVLPIEIKLPKPKDSESKYADSKSLKDYVILRTIRSIERAYCFRFTAETVELMRQQLGAVDARHDVTYFLRRKVSLAKCGELNSTSNCIMRNFRMYEAYERFFSDFSSQDKALFLHIIWLSGIMDDDSVVLSKYLPQNLKELKLESFSTAWARIKTHALGTLGKRQNTQLIFLLGYFIEVGELPDRVNKWLASRDNLAYIKGLVKIIEQEFSASYSKLAFPFQEARMSETRHKKSVNYWAKEFELSEELLYKVLDRKHEEEGLDLTGQDMYRLQRVLTVHCALFEDGKQVSWLQVLADWAHADEHRLKTVQVFLSKFDQKLPKPTLTEDAHADHKTLKKYVIVRTIRAAEQAYGCKFTLMTVDLMSKQLGNIYARHDVAYVLHQRELARHEADYFLRHKELPKISGEFQSASKFIMRCFRIYEAYEGFLSEFSGEDKALFLHLIWLSRIENDDTVALRKYLPFNLKKLTPESFSLVWACIKTSALETLKKREENQLIYLLGFFIENPDCIGTFSFKGLKILEVIKFFSRNQPTRSDRVKEYLTAKKEFKEFEKHLAQISDFDKNQKPFLYALYKEEAFHKYLHFLNQLAYLTGEKFDKDFAFHFLMSDFVVEKITHSGVPKPVYEKLMDALGPLINALRALKPDKQELREAVGAIMVQLSEVSSDFDQNNICFQWQELMWTKLDLVEKDDRF